MNSRRQNNDDLPKPEGAPVDPADANFSAEWNETIEQIGFTGVQILWEPGENPTDWERLFEEYGTMISKQHLGHLDSIVWFPRKRAFYYVHKDRLRKGLHYLTAAMGAAMIAGLLTKVRVAFFDTELKRWREILPAYPE